MLKASLKTLTPRDGGVPSENISLEVGNGQYGAEILVNLDIRNLPPGVKDVAKAQQDNLETLQNLIKMLGAHTGGRLDSAKLEKGHGQCSAFICRHQGFTEKDGRHYHKISKIFTGQIADIERVPEVHMPAMPGASALLPSQDPAPFFG